MNWLILTLTFAGLSFGFDLTKKEFIFEANRGEEVELYCKSDDFGDYCTFQTPQGTVLCNPDSSIDGCTIEEYVEQESYIGQECKVKISSVEDLHYGDWKCTLNSEFYNRKVTGVARLQKPQTLSIEFYNVWGTVVVNTAGNDEAKTFSCAVKGFDKTQKPRGTMHWSIDGEGIGTSSDFEEIEPGFWISKFLADGLVPDEHNDLSCEYKEGDKPIGSDHIKIHTILFEEQSNAKEIIFKEGDVRTVEKIFRVIPGPKKDSGSWKVTLLDSSYIMLTSGNSDIYAKALKIENISEDTFKATLKIASNVPKNYEDIYADFTINVGTGSDVLPFVLPTWVRLEVPAASIAPLEEPKFEEISIAPSEQVKEKEEAEKGQFMGASVVIVVAIIVCVALLAAGFYFMRWWNARHAEVDDKDAENGKREPLALGRNEEAMREEKKNLANSNKEELDQELEKLLPKKTVEKSNSTLERQDALSNGEEFTSEEEDVDLPHEDKKEQEINSKVQDAPNDEHMRIDEILEELRKDKDLNIEDLNDRLVKESRN